MEKWEEIIKDSLKDSQESLPEGDFALFQEKLSASTGNSVKKTATVIPFAKIAKVAVPALASCAAAVLVLVHPFVAKDTLENDIALPKTVTSENVVADVISKEETAKSQEIDVLKTDQATETKVKGESGRSVRSSSNSNPNAVALNANITSNSEEIMHETVSEEIAIEDRTSQIVESQTKDSAVTEESKKQAVDEIMKSTSSYPSSSSVFGGNEPIIRDRKKGKVGTAIAGVAGGTLAGILASSFASSDVLAKSYDAEYSGPLASGDINIGYSGADLGMIEDDIAGIYHYVIPFKAGLTARYSLTDKLYLMSGLEYSMYYTKVEYPSLTTCKEFAHYVGIPLRLDWNFASIGKFDFYAGAGADVDFCVKATHEGGDIDKDKPIFSVVGATGIQYNFCERMGLYLEPQLIWGPTSENYVLSTYRKEHPLMFTAAVGLRFNL